MYTNSLSRWLTAWLVVLVMAVPMLGTTPSRIGSYPGGNGSSFSLVDRGDAHVNPIIPECSGQGGSGGSCGGG